MTRREFARRCTLIAAGIIAADQLELAEMLAPRKYFPGAEFDEWKAGPERDGGRFSYFTSETTCGLYVYYDPRCLEKLKLTRPVSGMSWGK